MDERTTVGAGPRVGAAVMTAAALLLGVSAESSAVVAQEADTLPASPAFRVLCADMPADDAYVPPYGAWERRRPSEVGLDSAALEEAAAWATDTAHSGIRPDLQRDLNLFVAGEPENTIVGPVKNRGPQAGGSACRAPRAAATGAGACGSAPGTRRASSC